MEATFFDRKLALGEPGQPDVHVQATIRYDETEFGNADGPSPWTVSITGAGRDLGRIVGFEGTGARIIGMHGLKPDPHAARGFEITVYRMGEVLVRAGGDAAVFGALERWLLKTGWRGNVIKRLKFADAAQVLPIRTFWLNLGFELLTWTNEWDEHVVKRWR